jgi:hypothetical protein
MQPAGVVPTLDELEDSVVKSCSREPRAAIDEFSFDGGEKRFGYGIVPALTG